MGNAEAPGFRETARGGRLRGKHVVHGNFLTTTWKGMSREGRNPKLSMSYFTSSNSRNKVEEGQSFSCGLREGSFPVRVSRASLVNLLAGLLATKSRGQVDPVSFLLSLPGDTRLAEAHARSRISRVQDRPSRSAPGLGRLTIRL